VSVAILTEGPDANTVSTCSASERSAHCILCERVIGRALWRQSYDPNEGAPDQCLFTVEYGGIFGILFDFTATPVGAPPQLSRETIQVEAMRPERDALAIRFPRLEGCQVELTEERLDAEFNDDSTLILTPALVGPSITRNAGITHPAVDLNLAVWATCSPLIYWFKSPSGYSTPSSANLARSPSCTRAASSSRSPSSGSTSAPSARAEWRGTAVLPP
jgi:type III restriction enzyme